MTKLEKLGANRDKVPVATGQRHTLLMSDV
jgi:hypothetical protein